MKRLVTGVCTIALCFVGCSDDVQGTSNDSGSFDSGIKTDGGDAGETQSDGVIMPDLAAPDLSAGDSLPLDSTPPADLGVDSTPADSTADLSPGSCGDVDKLRAAPTEQAVYLSWSLPGCTSLGGVIVLRRIGAPVAAVPTPGASYAVGDLIGGAEVIYNSSGLNLLDGSLQNGTTYHYRVFVYDTASVYSSGVASHATPRTMHPTSYNSYTVELSNIVSLGSNEEEITDLVFTLDGSDRPHALLKTGEGGYASGTIYYVTCTGGCAAPSDWTVVKLADTSNRGLDIAVDSKNRVRVVYPQFAFCDAGCDSLFNWSVGGPQGWQVEVDAADNITVAPSTGQSFVVSQCKVGCATDSNWTHATLSYGAASYLNDFEVSPSGKMALIYSRYDNSKYRVYRAACATSCLDPGNWIALHELPSTAGSVSSASIRFTDDELGIHQLLSYHRQYFACEDCFPGYPPQHYKFAYAQTYDVSRLALTRDDQPRVLTYASSGQPYLLACDFRCDVDTNWNRVHVNQDPVQTIKLQLASDDRPVMMWSLYGSTEFRYMRGN